MTDLAFYISKEPVHFVERRFITDEEKEFLKNKLSDDINDVEVLQFSDGSLIGHVPDDDNSRYVDWDNNDYIENCNDIRIIEIIPLKKGIYTTLTFENHHKMSFSYPVICENIKSHNNLLVFIGNVESDYFSVVEVVGEYV